MLQEVIGGGADGGVEGGPEAGNGGGAKRKLESGFSDVGASKILKEKFKLFQIICSLYLFDNLAVFCVWICAACVVHVHVHVSGFTVLLFLFLYFFFFLQVNYKVYRDNQKFLK